MGRYLIRRLLWGAFTLWGLATLVFFLLRLFPGGPFDEDLALSVEMRAILEKVYGISESGLHSYFSFLRSCLEGNFGVSLYFPGQSVAASIGRGLEAGFFLNVGALVLALCLSLAMGLLPHLFLSSREIFRWMIRVGLSLPALFLAPLLLWFFCFRWGFFPIRVTENTFSYVLPIFLLALRPACGMARILDTQLQEAQLQNHARTFFALGASRRRLVWRWLLRGCLPAFVQQVPNLAASLLSGNLAIEMLFGVHGLGTQLMESLLNRDWSLALGLTLFFGLILVLVQILADALLMWLDPRVAVQ